MARRPNKFLAEKVCLSVQIAAASDADSKAYAMVVPPGRKFRIERAYYVSLAGYAEHSSNAHLLSVKKGTTIMASWNTDSDGAEADNSVAADTPQALTLSSTAADLVADAGDVISCLDDESGTTTTVAGTFLIEGTLY